MQSHLLMNAQHIYHNGARGIASHYTTLLFLESVCKLIATGVDMGITGTTLTVLQVPDIRLVALVTLLAALSLIRPHILAFSSGLYVMMFTSISNISVFFSAMFSVSTSIR